MSDNTFQPRTTPSAAERLFTIAAIGIALIGVALIAFGPVRIVASTVMERVGASDDVTTASSQGARGGLLNPAAGGGLTFGDTLQREVQPYTIIPDRPVTEVFSYTVQAGDTLLGIAADYNVDPQTIIWSNPRTLGGNAFLSPGMQINILPIDGAYHLSYDNLTIREIAEEYSVEPDVILNSSYNEEIRDLTADDTPPWGVYVVVPGGQGDPADLYREVIVESPGGGGAVSFMPGMGGSCGSIAGGGGTGTYINPVPGATVTQGYYPGHGGIDFGGVMGTPILASDSGVVIFSGRVNPDWGYGILVVLDHGGGRTSYYAHLSATSVGCGARVGQGQQIGALGSTGDSTGPHLHFETRLNHIPVNPANYLGF